VTELAPFVAFLQRSSAYRSLIFEEPEAHLHLEAQRKIAGVIARIVNKGLPVLVTTHGDTFFQQINNFIKMSRYPERAVNLGYENGVFLDPGDVRAYQFVPSENGRSSVEPLDMTEDGLAATTFNRSIGNLFAETRSLWRDEDREPRRGEASEDA
jgi:hypothetical protein